MPFIPACITIGILFVVCCACVIWAMESNADRENWYRQWDEERNACLEKDSDIYKAQRENAALRHEKESLAQTLATARQALAAREATLTKLRAHHATAAAILEEDEIPF